MRKADRLKRIPSLVLVDHNLKLCAASEHFKEKLSSLLLFVAFISNIKMRNVVELSFPAVFRLAFVKQSSIYVYISLLLYCF
jgi:hypothetical protein